MKPRVLLVEDDAERGRVMLAALSGGFECRHIAVIGEAIAALNDGAWAAVVANYGLDAGGSGLELLQIVRETLPRAFRLVYSEVHSPSFRRDARRIVEPHFVTDSCSRDLVGDIDRALAALLAPVDLDVPADLQSIRTDVWTARAPVMRAFLDELRAAAEQDTPVYVHGEPGTGVTRAGVTLRQWRAEWKSRRTPPAARVELPVPVLRVPALRERPQDLPVLAARCLLEHAQQTGDPPRQLGLAETEELLSRTWYGNVVELRAVLVHAVQRAGAREVIRKGDLPQDSHPSWRPSHFAKNEGQRDCVLRQLRMARTVSSAARLEGCSRANYIRLMRRLGIIRADVPAEMLMEEQAEDAVTG